MRKSRLGLWTRGFLVAAALAALAGVAVAAPVEDVYAKKGMVSSAHVLASKAGVEILKKGGNAVDAAVATALALNVVEPYNCGIGGGGFMTIRFAKTGEVIFLDYREMAPGSARKDMFASEEAQKKKWSDMGGRAAGVPGFVKGMFYALEKYGTMSFAEVAQPAIRLAEQGFVLEAKQNEPIQEFFDQLVEQNKVEDLPVLKDGLPLEGGQLLKQTNLAKAFRLLSKDGEKAFYEGPIGQALIATINKNTRQKTMTMEDLKKYHVEVRKPVEGTYRGYHIYSAPPASSGGTHVIQLLNMMENYDVKAMGPKSLEKLHLFTEAMRLVFADRTKYMADTAFAKVPLKGLTSKAYAKELIRRIQPDRAMAKGTPGDPWSFDGPSVSYKAGMGREHFSTTHLSVVDQQGNIVATTNTINEWFGSRLIVPSFGMFVNNQMDDFSSDPQSVNAPEPGKRMLSSMSPTVVMDPEGKPFMTLGAAGSRRILTVVAQVIMNVVDHGMTMDEAIEFPRVYCTEEGVVSFEDAFGKDLIRGMEKKGHKLKLGETYYGVSQGILFKGKDGMMDGGADGRFTGVPVGF